jgi:hypothetical protein
MTVKQIAEAVGKDERTVRRWVKSVADKMSVVADKMSASTSTHPADYTQQETMAIIREGMGDAPAGVYQANAEAPRQVSISSKDLQQIRLAVRDGIMEVHEARRILGLTEYNRGGRLPDDIARQVYAVASKAYERKKAAIEDRRKNPELFS